MRTMEYDSALKRNKVLILGYGYVLENMTLSQKRQTEEDTGLLISRGASVADVTL